MILFAGEENPPIRKGDFPAPFSQSSPSIASFGKGRLGGFRPLALTTFRLSRITLLHQKLSCIKPTMGEGRCRGAACRAPTYICVTRLWEQVGVQTKRCFSTSESTNL